MDRAEVVAKVRYLVDTHHGGDWRLAFDFYARGDSRVNGDDLFALLKDAGVGNFITRSTYVSKIIDVIDRDGDGAISWDEFEFVFRGA